MKLFVAFFLLGVLATTFAEVSNRQSCSGVIVNNADGTKSCVTVIGYSSTGAPIYQYVNLTTGTKTYQTQTGTSATGTPIYSTCTASGTPITTTRKPVTTTTKPLTTTTKPTTTTTKPLTTTMPTTTTTTPTTVAPAPAGSTTLPPAGSTTLPPAGSTTVASAGSTTAAVATTTVCVPVSCVSPGVTVNNADGTQSCVTVASYNSAGYPVYQYSNLLTCKVTYTTQTGTNADGTPIYTETDQFGNPTTLPPPATTVAPAPGGSTAAPGGSTAAPGGSTAAPSGSTAAPATVAPCVPVTCTSPGIVVNNADGTQSCVTVEAYNSLGNPVYKYSNLASCAVTYVSQSGTNADGTPIYIETDQFGNPTTVAPPTTTMAPTTAGPTAASSTTPAGGSTTPAGASTTPAGGSTAAPADPTTTLAG